jgi:hypothetical protein
MKLSFKANVWLYPGMSGWYFVSLPKALAEKVKAYQDGKPRRGWGAVAAEVTVGKTTWKTSIFPDKKSGSYLLALKVAVRKKEGIFVKDTISLKVEI